VDDAAVLRPDQARVLQRGNDLTIVSWSSAVNLAVQGAAHLEKRGVSASVIDLRSLWPWDKDTVLADCVRTGRLLVVHEAVQVGGFGAEVAATAAQATGCRIARLGAPRIHVGFAPQLETVVRIRPQDIVQAAMAMFEHAVADRVDIHRR